MNNDFSKKNRSKKVKYGPMLCFTHLNTSPVFRPPPKLLLSQPAEQKAAARIATGTLTVVQHKQRIGAASVKVSSAILPRGRSSSACTTHPAF